jgi:YegS/Rv2252/BmrU family lipid kinase
VAQRTLVIVNPRSRNGATGRRWRGYEARLREVLGPLEVEHTRAPRDAERLAREAVRAGVERVLVAGGDGTLSEVATGLLAAQLADYATVGLLPLGTGGDFARSLGVPRDLEGALACIAAGKTRKVDAGRALFLGEDGEERTAYFVNVSSFGISGLIDELVNRTSKRLGGTVSFLVGTLRAIFQYRSTRVAIRVDGELVHDAGLILATAANGRYFGGGMRVAPEARIDDGLLDVVIVADLPIAKLLLKLPKIYAGTHLAEEAAVLHRGRVIEATASPGRVKLDLDGEPLGTLPARCEVLPGALTLFGPGA